MDAGVRWTVLEGRLSQLERNRRRSAGTPDNWDAYQFTAFPTCPPTAALYIRGGRMVWPASWGEGVSYYLSDATLDFTSEDASLDAQWPYSFTNANWYLPIYVTITWSGASATIDADGYGTPRFRLYGADYYSYWGGGYTEYETSAEAEDAISGLDTSFYQDHLVEVGLPICRVVLRNNGVTGQPYQFLPVQKVNRGQSYLWGLFRNGRYTS